MLNDLYVFPILIAVADSDWCRMGLDWAMSLMHYGERWRSQRRVMHDKLHPRVVIHYQPIQLKHTRLFTLIFNNLPVYLLNHHSALLYRLYDTPDRFVEHLRHTSGAVIMEVRMLNSHNVDTAQ